MVVLVRAYRHLRRPYHFVVKIVSLANLVDYVSVLRLGHVYEWTLRTRVTNGILGSLAELPRAPQPGELLVIDGVWDYGRGRRESWGLSVAVSLAHGLRGCWACSNPVRVATTVHVKNGKLLANESWDVPWEIDPATTRFFAWDEQAYRLKTSSLKDYLARHPEVVVPASTERVFPG